MESDPKIDPSFDITAEEVKKQEKEMMAYDSKCHSDLNCFISLCNSAGDLSVALKFGQSASRGKGKARGRGVQGKGRDAPSTSGTSDGGRRGKGGSKSGRGAFSQEKRYCYKCRGGE